MSPVKPRFEANESRMIGSKRALLEMTVNDLQSESIETKSKEVASSWEPSVKLSIWKASCSENVAGKDSLSAS